MMSSAAEVLMQVPAMDRRREKCVSGITANEEVCTAMVTK